MKRLYHHLVEHRWGEPDDDVKLLSLVPITPHENHILAEHGGKAFLDYWERSGIDVFAPRSDPDRVV